MKSKRVRTRKTESVDEDSSDVEELAPKPIVFFGRPAAPPQPVPNSLPSQKPLPSQKSYPEKDPLVTLCKGKVSSQQLEELKSSACDEKILLRKFYTGTLKIGISQDNLYWDECATIFAETPNKIEKLKKDVAEAKLFIQKKKDEITKLENRKRKLNEEVDKLTNQLHSTLKSLKGLEMVTDSLQEKTKKVANIEKNLVNDMQVQLVKDFKKFSSLREESKFPKLSLIFNAMGISPETIHALQDFTGVRFNYEDLNDCVNHYGIINFEEQKDLCYIRHMMQEKLLSTNHVENCVVCACKTPLEFKNLLKEREITLSMGFNFLEKFHLNGPRFLFINYSDSTKLFMLNRDQTEQLMNLKEQLLSLHLYDEIEPKTFSNIAPNFDYPHYGGQFQYENQIQYANPHNTFYQLPPYQMPDYNHSIYQFQPEYQEQFQQVDRTGLSPDQIDSLVQMGFSEVQAVTTLREHGYEKALEVLLDRNF